MAIRLLKACKDLNIGISTAIAFCEKIGKEIAMDVSSRIDDELYLRLAKEFNKDLALKLEAKSQEREIPKVENNKTSLIDIVDMVKESKNRPNREGTQNETTDSNNTNQQESPDVIKDSDTLNLSCESKQNQDNSTGDRQTKNNSTKKTSHMKNESQKTGLFELGYIENNKSYVDDLQKLLDGTDQIATKAAIDEACKNAEYYNEAGYKSFPNGDSVTKETAEYIRFETQYKTAYNKTIYGLLSKSKNGFVGVEWAIGHEKKFKRKILIEKNRFYIGCMFFDNKEKGLKFLEDIASNTIPEVWKFKKQKSQINYPILKSYLEHVLERLKKEEKDGQEDKIIYNKDRTYVMFNTNLLDKFFHDVIIVGEVVTEKNDLHIKNPYCFESDTNLKELGFEKTTPIQPNFFDDIKDVIYQAEWTVDKAFKKFTHIIEDRIERFPPEYRELSTDELAIKLDGAIDRAVELAQRNYKFIVPMYRPQTHSIQLLMPIYLGGIYRRHPDFALVLTPIKKTKTYMPETILSLDAAYQNARLIAKPDELWMNPDLVE